MNQEHSIIKKNVMRRVRFIHFTRKILNPKTIKLGVLVVFLALESWFVSIPHVVSNFGNSAKSFGSLYAYVVSAFLNTQITVQLLSVGIAIIGILFALDFARKS